MTVRSIRVLNTFPLSRADLDALGEVSPRLDIVSRELGGDELAALQDDDVEVILGGRLPSEPASTPNLRWLQIPSGGLERIAPPSGGLGAWPHPVVVTNGSGAYAPAVGEYLLWAILDFVQKGNARRGAHRDRLWPSIEEENPFLGRPLAGLRVLIVGYGSVGRHLAGLLAPLGVEVVAVKKDPASRRSRTWAAAGTGDPEGSIPVLIGGPTDIPRLAESADVLAVTLPATSETDALVGSEALAALPQGALVVVAGRGSTVDFAALRSGLDSDHLGSAVVDSPPGEPLGAEHDLWHQDRMLITTHIAGGRPYDPIGHELPVFLELLKANLRRYATDQPLLNRVDLQRGY